MNRTALISGLVFIVLGLIFLGEDLGLLDVAADLIVPVLLLALGVGIILGVHRGDDRREAEPPPREEPSAGRSDEAQRADETDQGSTTDDDDTSS